MLPYLREHFGNPSSSHLFGRTMHHAVARAREQVARLIECRPEEVYFTSGGTRGQQPGDPRRGGRHSGAPPHTYQCYRAPGNGRTLYLAWSNKATG